MNGFQVIVALLIFCFFPATLSAVELSSSEMQAIVLGSDRIYVWLGAKHMLTGIDHLLFIVGMVFLLKRFIDVLTHIMAFTIAHSFTLLWSTYYGVHLHILVVDAVIALSVLYIAMANLDGFRRFVHLPTPNLMISVMLFGLIHGFGLAQRLQEIQISSNDLLLHAVLFNVGVEFGQVIALSCILIWLSLFRKSQSFEFIRKVSSYGLIAMSFLLLVYHVGIYQQQMGQTSVSTPQIINMPSASSS